MRVGIIASIAKPVASLSYGGTEVFCANLANELNKRGHEVLLFASGDSHVDKNISLIPSVEYSLEHAKSSFLNMYKRVPSNEEKRELINSIDIRSLIKAKELENKIDIFHDNTCSSLLGAVSNLFSKPIISTIHMPVNEAASFLTLPPLITKPTNIYVSVSDFQKNLFSKVAANIYNGVDTLSYKPTEIKERINMIWLGRINPRSPKGLMEAIQVANQSKRHLYYSGHASNQIYFDSKIKPLFSEYVHNIPLFKTLEEKVLFYNSGKLLLMPIMWDEPFGLVMTESMACGTPVIAFARGAVPEVIKDGETGFIVNPSDSDIRGDWIIKKTGVEGLQEAIERVYAMPEEQYIQMRKNCRKHVEKNFTIERMVDQYEALYKEIIEKKNYLPSNISL